MMDFSQLWRAHSCVPRRDSSRRLAGCNTSAGVETSLDAARTSAYATSKTITLLACLLSAAASAQVICALGPGAASYKTSADQRPTSDAMQLAGRVNTAVKTICGSNCPGVMVLRNTTAANVMLIAEGGQAKLVYSPQFFAAANDTFGDAGIVAIIAHELGHALDDGLGAAWIKTTWTPELRADSWTGCVLARTGLSPKDLELALSALAKYPSQLEAAAHPGWTLRLPVLRTGFTQCGGEGAKFDGASTRKPVR